MTRAKITDEGYEHDTEVDRDDIRAFFKGETRRDRKEKDSYEVKENKGNEKESKSKGSDEGGSS
jgi:hypothetical protein